jgi:predicted transcriptional regulator
MDHPVTVETFTLPAAAEALGRSEATFRRWIEDDKVPRPRLQDVTRHYMVYSAGELEAMARVISEHEQEFKNLVAANSQVVERLHQAVYAYRDLYI